MTIIQTSTPGPQGPAGNSILSTTGAPANTVGNNGDFAHDVAASMMYGPKANGAWPSGVSYKGTNGQNGTNGAQGPQGPQGIPADGAKWKPGTSYTGLVATRAKQPTGCFLGIFKYMSRSIHVAQDDISSIGLSFAAWYSTTVQVPLGEKPIGADGTVIATIEYPLNTGQCVNVKFGGANTGTILNGTTKDSDLTPLGFTIPKGASFGVREFRTVHDNGDNSSGVPIVNSNINANLNAGDCFLYTGTVTDLTSVPGAFTNSTVGVYARPAAIWGTTSNPSYAIMGDSIAEGLLDDGTVSLDVGCFARSIGPKRAYMQLAYQGEEVSQAVNSWAFIQRHALAMRFASHIACNYGYNDFNAGNLDYVTVLRNLRTMRAMFPGKYFYVSTIMAPVQAGLEDQPLTPPTTLVKSIQLYNNWLRSGSVGAIFDGFFDVAGALEPTIGALCYANKLWSGDTVHPSPSGYAQIAIANVVTVA